MAQAYSDPSREADPHALPDVEVFYVSDQLKGDDTLASHAAGVEPSWCEFDNGWYYWFCFPGCLPDGDPVGPFDTEAQALADAQDGDQ
jgi:hypothetical protein